MSDAANFRRRMRERTVKPAQPPLPGTIPCPYCNVTDPAKCAYDRGVRRLGLLPAGPRPRGCLVNLQGELPAEF